MKIAIALVCLAAAFLLLKGFSSGGVKPRPSQVAKASWSRSAVIYELNTRQFSPEGTFKAVIPRVPELKDLGVDIVWFMPIHPIGEKNRKGDLGSPYAVKDYFAVNPHLGTMADFKALVEELHRAGIHVLIDLVANHTAWDNSLTVEHPEWYAHRGGRFVPPVPDWQDVIQLDYTQKGLRGYMISVMEYWVREAGIDGYRCDVAAMVPVDFWEEARERLDKMKPVFLLAEAEKPGLLERAFDADYGSEYYNLFNALAKGLAPVKAIDVLISKDEKAYPPGSRRLHFITNHDQNSWHGSEIRRLGPDGSRAFAVLTFTLPGIPLIYNGQEIGNEKMLGFFTRDPIPWKRNDELRGFYSKLCCLRHRHPALYGGAMVRVPSPRRVYAFLRRGEKETILVAVNLSPLKEKITLSATDDVTGAVSLMQAGTFPVRKGKLSLTLGPWGYGIFELR
jgi:glycosidase